MYSTFIEIKKKKLSVVTISFDYRLKIMCENYYLRFLLIYFFYYILFNWNERVLSSPKILE